MNLFFLIFKSRLRWHFKWQISGEHTTYLNYLYSKALQSAHKKTATSQPLLIFLFMNELFRKTLVQMTNRWILWRSTVVVKGQYQNNHRTSYLLKTKMTGTINQIKMVWLKERFIWHLKLDSVPIDLFELSFCMYLNWWFMILISQSWSRRLIFYASIV